jgi:hypothetical protein
LPDFSGFNIPKWKKYTNWPKIGIPTDQKYTNRPKIWIATAQNILHKWSLHIPNGHYIHQIAITYTKWPLLIPNGCYIYLCSKWPLHVPNVHYICIPNNLDPKYCQMWYFGMQIRQLATPVSSSFRS